LSVEFRVLCVGFVVSSYGIWGFGFGSRVWGLVFQVLGFGVWGLGLRFGVWGFGF